MKLGEKQEYVRALLASLSKMRRETGVPHRIIIDEAHYFLNDPEVIKLLDLELAGYTLITYRASDIHADILAATEAIIVTRETDPREVRALRTLQGSNESQEKWQTVLENLAMNEAALLPKTEEAGGSLCRFDVAPRMTAHVRHQHKYLDMPLPEEKAFRFDGDSNLKGRRARSLKEFTAILAGAVPEALDVHLRNGDFSRWIGGVFRDHTLAVEIEELEDQYRLGQIPDINDALIQCVEDRYRLRNPP
jgi:hypothetical protein